MREGLCAAAAQGIADGGERGVDVLVGPAGGVAELLLGVVGSSSFDQVQVVALPAAGQSDVAGLAVEGIRAKEHGALAGQALCLVHGEGVAVVQAAVAQVARVDTLTSHPAIWTVSPPRSGSTALITPRWPLIRPCR